MTHAPSGRSCNIFAALIPLAVAAALLAACSGNGEPDPTTTQSPDRTASTSPAAATPSPQPATPRKPELSVYDVPAGSHPHDVAPAADGGVWYTAQATGRLGWLDPATGETREIPLGAGSAPHGVIVGPDGAAWITDGGLNAIVRVDPQTSEVTVFPLPADRPNANLNTAAFDGRGVLWFTGRTASSAAWTPTPARWTCSTRREVAGPTASRPPPPATSTSPLSPAATSAG